MARWLSPVLFGIAFLFMLHGQWKPFAFTDFGGESWTYVLSEAAAGRYRFGTDIVFTGGPLSDFYRNFFNPGTFVSTLVMNHTVLGLQALTLTVLVARSRTVFFPLVLLLSLAFIVLRDVLLLWTPLLVALVALSRPTDRSSVVMGVVGAVISGLCTLAKFSLFPLSVGLFLLVDLNRLRLRSLPLATASYLLAFYLSFLLLSPSGSDFPSFFAGSLETSAGYAAAMSLHGLRVELVAYGVLAILALAGLFVTERRRRIVAGHFEWETALSLLALALFAWIGVKAGFVRHDTHGIFAFSGLAIGLCTYGVARLSPRVLGWGAPAILAAVVVLAGFHPHVRFAVDPTVNIPVQVSLADSATAAPREFERSLRALLDPDAWLAERRRLSEAARAVRAQAAPVRVLDGTVDSLPTLQHTLIAAGLDYRPRPTVDEYTTYTPALVQRNRAFFAGTRAPDYFLFWPATIDNRYPGLAEGPLWPLLLSRYAPSHLAGDTVVLRRRATPVGELLRPGESGIGTLAQPLPIRFGEDPVFLSLDLRLTLLGRLVEFLFKPPHLQLGVTTADGGEQIYRLIPGIAREGFVVSPMVRTARDFVVLAEGGGAGDVRPVTAVRVLGNFPSRLAYGSTFAYAIRFLDRARLAESRTWSLPPEQAASFARDRGFDSLIYATERPTPGFRIINEGLFAHAPRGFFVPVSGASDLTIGFGMLPGAWSGTNATNGVCFRVRDVQAKTIWERCLDPLQTEGDRTPGQATIALPAGTERVLLETDCREHCSWDWSYWSQITPER
jgi:hypothetical protein